MKKNILKISLIIMILQLFSVFSFADSKPTLYVKDIVKYKNQDKVTVEIFMENTNSKIVTLGLDLEYDSSKLEYLDSEAGKDLNATIKLAENVPDESRVAIGIVSLGGLKKDGIYYEIDFKVKDMTNDIPLKLKVKEATDSNGNEIEITSRDGTIKISKDDKKEEKQEVATTNQQINNFEKTEVEDLENIEELIKENGNIEISNEDCLAYETVDSNVVEILDDGTMIPNQDGTTKVKVKLNDQIVGNIEVEVKDGKITKLSGNEETKTNSETNNYIEENKEDKTIDTKDKEDSKLYLSKGEENQISENKNLKYVVVLIVVITILFIIFYLIKKKRGGNK